MRKASSAIIVMLLLAAITLAQAPTRTSGKNSATGAADSINAGDILRHIKMLASDEFEGRGPATRGEELSVQYLSDQLKGMGLKPGNPDGSYVQKVPLVGFTTTGTASITAGGKELALKRNEDYVAVSRRFTPQNDVNESDVVFVGYGVVAPEYGWDDYKGVDVRGKTIVMLVNDPAVPDPKDPAKKDPAFFKGNAMTYYGRWTYKYEIAAEKGAAAAIIVHDTIPAGYPFEVITGSWGRENFDIQKPDKNMGRPAVEGWISNAKARELVTGGGQDLDALQKAAVRKDFKPVTLNAKASFHLQNQLREVNSQNVIAKLEGSDAKAKNEYVIYSAHWDHLGKDPNRQGDQIFNGAIDNASGCAGLLEIAEAYSKLPTKPRRSVLFLFVTAEEKGLLGSKYYAANPLYPLNKTLANINMDGLNQWGRTKDMSIVGYGNSTMDDILKAKATAQNRTVGAEKEPENGTFYRSDHFEFAKQGVPALYIHSGDDYIGKAPGYAQGKRDYYRTNDYHKPSDEVKSDWDLSGAVEDLQLLFAVGLEVAQGNKWPEWKPGTEFKAKREASLRAAVNVPGRAIRWEPARNSAGGARIEMAHYQQGRSQDRSSGKHEIKLSTDVQKVEAAYVGGSLADRRTSPGSVIAALAVSGLDELNGPLTFQYKVSGGVVIGQAEEVKWDLTGVPPGVYTASVEVSSDGMVYAASRELEILSPRAYTARTESLVPANFTPIQSPHGDDAHGFYISMFWGRRAPMSEVPNHPPVAEISASTAILARINSTQLVPISSAGFVTLTTNASDPDGDPLILVYTATAGRILGEGPVVQWDLTGVEPGKYSATVEVNDGYGCINWQTVEVRVTG